MALKSLNVAKSQFSDAFIQNKALSHDERRDVQANLAQACLLRGDILRDLGRVEEAQIDYTEARQHGAQDAEQKLSSLSPSALTTLNWEKSHTLKEHSDSVCSVAYSPSGARLASGKCPIEESSQSTLQTRVPLNLAQTETSLHHAVSVGNIDSLEEILKKCGVNINKTDQNNKTALHLATQSDQIKIMQILIEKGANVDARDDQNKTPLHYAADIGSKVAVNKLLYYGANFHAIDKNGRIPLELADAKNHIEIMKIMLKRMLSIKVVSGNSNKKEIDFSKLTSAIEERNKPAVLSALGKKY